MKVSHSALPRGPVSHLGGVHNAAVMPMQAGQGDPAHAGGAPGPNDIASQLAAIQPIKAQ